MNITLPLRVAVLVIAGMGLALTRCGPVRNGLATLAPTVPGNGACIDGAKRCNGLVPESCRTYDGVPRWWPLAALDDRGRPAPCAHWCVVEDGGAPHCAGAVDGGAL